MSDQEDDGPRILIIDDTRAIHATIRSVLEPKRSEGAGALDELAADLFEEVPMKTAPPEPSPYQIDSALQGKQGLAMVEQSLQSERPYSLAFVDMRMPPGWDGLETIDRIWQVDPDLQIVICTAYSDRSWSEIRTHLGVSDKLLILKKPFDAIEVAQMAETMTAKWKAARAERLLLRQTLGRAVEVMGGDLLALVTPSAAQRTELLRVCVAHMVQALGLHHWAYELAAGLSQIGCMMVPAELAFAQRAGHKLGSDDRQTFRRHPSVAAKMIRQIPRMRLVAEIVTNQLVPLPVKWSMRDEEHDPWVIAAGSQILHAALVYDTELQRNPSRREALAACQAAGLSPELLQSLVGFRPKSEQWRSAQLQLDAIKPGMVFERDVLAQNGMLVCPAKTRVTRPLLERLHNFAHRLDEGHEFAVRVPATMLAKVMKELESVK